MNNYNIGLEIGEEYINAAVVDVNYNIFFKTKCKTSEERSATAIENNMLNLIDILLKESKLSIDDIDNIGIACPGIVNSKTKTVEYACNFNFKGEDLTFNIQKKYGKPTYIENDAKAAALAEYMVRVKAQNYELKDMVFLMLVNGLGGGIIIDGKLYKGFNFAGGEIGHMVIEKDGRQCTCGRKGCFETYCSIVGIEKTAQEVLKKHENSVLFNIKKEAGGISVKDIFEAAEKKDEAAVEIVNIFLEYLVVGVTNVVNIFQPKLLVMGGFLTKEIESIKTRLTEEVEKLDYARSLEEKFKLEISKLGEEVGVIGASILYKF